VTNNQHRRYHYSAGRMMWLTNVFSLQATEKEEPMADVWFVPKVQKERSPPECISARSAGYPHAGAAGVSAPSAYETRALAQIRKWKSPSHPMWKRALAAIGKPLMCWNLVMKIPGLGFVIEKANSGARVAPGGWCQLVGSGPPPSLRSSGGRPSGAGPW